MTHDLLRFATAGSVDDGKSTLVGRLLHDTKSVLADQLAAIERVSSERGMEVADLALLTDGLRAEREQGITIDVAYRYFSTATRSFILADTPGHVQYTRNMVTGASTAELALILIDVRHGVVEQTRRHTAIAALLGVRHVAVTVNKMDLVDYSQDEFNAVEAEFTKIATSLGIADVVAIPVSALVGDNVVDRSQRTSWYDGPTLLEFLEEVQVGLDPRDQAFRLPVQYVNRPRTAEYPDFRGYSGRISSGSVAVGDEVTITNLRRTSTVTAIDVVGEPTDVAFAPQSVTIQLADDIDVHRGDVIATADQPPRLTREITATICILSETPISTGQRLLARIGPKTVRAIVGSVVDRLDLETLEHAAHTDALTTNDVGTITLRFADDVAIDNYDDLRTTGAFILVDDQDGSTLAGGMARS
ncbi:MAG: sulfate adenylyltransferase subunit 1 [Actinomycetes bacterium]|jgi:sulfate adenylyltransferase subunit 1